ncbi:M28 family metallopeptidase [Pedobacter sp.]|uniref:M28 family metallopeptidase n=1 Tax=Pedobacter sp. TaxID=1411316 RepID=UPI003D7F4583
MKIRILVYFIVLLSFSQTQAQEEYARYIVKELTAKSYHGRGYVFDGDRKAAQFLRNEFKKYKIQPLGDDYYQYYNLSANTFPTAPKVTINGKKYTLAVDYLIDAACPAIDGKFAIEVLELTSPDPQVIASIINNRNLEHKLLYIDEDLALTHMKAPQLREVIDQLKNAGFHKGLILNSKQKLKWRSLTYQNKKASINTQSLFLDAKVKNVAQLKISPQLNPEYQTQNVCGFIKGTGGSDSTIVITAHYDHIGAIGKKVYFPGANDNASGTSMLMYLAKYYAEHVPKYNVVFLAFSGEEIGLLGSKHYAKNPLLELGKIKFLLNLDMAGTGDEGVQVVNGTIFKKEFDTLVRLNKEHNLMPQVKVRGPMDRSDHFPFYEKSIPCFFFYTLGGIDAYHDIYDRYETLPFTKFNNYAKLLIYYIDQYNK